MEECRREVRTVRRMKMIKMELRRIELRTRRSIAIRTRRTKLIVEREDGAEV